MSRLTEADIDFWIDYTIDTEFSPEYRERVKRSKNVSAFRRYLKLVAMKKGADFPKRIEIRKALEKFLDEIQPEELIDGFSTFLWVKDLLVEVGAIEI